MLLLMQMASSKTRAFGQLRRVVRGTVCNYWRGHDWQPGRTLCVLRFAGLETLPAGKTSSSISQHIFCLFYSLFCFNCLLLLHIPVSRILIMSEYFGSVKVESFGHHCTAPIADSSLSLRTLQKLVRTWGVHW